MDNQKTEVDRGSVGAGAPPSQSSPPEPPEDPELARARRSRARRFKHVHAFSVAFFGALLPLILLVTAGYSLMTLQRDFTPAAGELLTTLKGAQDVVNQNKDNNAYAFAAFVIAEHSNFAVMHDKQRMKIAVMQIGFAVASVGIMFILLGVNDGGLTGKAEAGGLKVDFRTASTGVLTFVIGCALAGGAGLMRNDYATVGVPVFGEQAASDTGLLNYLGAVLKDCDTGPKDQVGNCLAESLASQLGPGEEEKK